MALTRHYYNNPTTRPTGESPLNYVQDTLLALGWVQDKVVESSNYVSELYFHSTHATDPVYVSAQSVKDTWYHNVYFYTNLGFDTGLAADAQPNGLSSLTNPIIYTPLYIPIAGAVTFDMFGDEETFYLMSFHQNTSSDSVNNRKNRATYNNVFYTGTLNKYMPFSGGQFGVQMNLTSTTLNAYNSFYYNGQWYHSNVSKGDGILSKINAHVSTVGYMERAGNLRAGGIIITPQIAYIDLAGGVGDVRWGAIGELPNLYQQKYGTTWNKLYKHEGKEYFSKVYGNPWDYMYSLFDVTP